MRALVVRDAHRGPSGRADHVARPYSCLGTACGSGTVMAHALSGGALPQLCHGAQQPARSPRQHCSSCWAGGAFPAFLL